MSIQDHYLKRELYTLFKQDDTLFEFLQLGSLDGVWYWNLENQKDEWMSPRFWELLGFSPDEKKHFVSEWQDLIFPEDLQIAINNFNKHCADANHPYDQVVRYRHKNGSTVWVRCRGVAIRDKMGKPVRMLGAHTDLTALKSAEEKLRKANEELRIALAEIRVLRGILPICSSCKQIRNDKGYWERVETYVAKRTDAKFSHDICPKCAKKLYPEFFTGKDG